MIRQLCKNCGKFLIKLSDIKKRIVPDNYGGKKIEVYCKFCGSTVIKHFQIEEICPECGEILETKYKLDNNNLVNFYCNICKTFKILNQNDYLTYKGEIKWIK